MRTLIKNGTVVTADESQNADVLVDGETIVGIAAAGQHAWEDGADAVIDATGKYVIPGAIDVHTHFELPFGGTFVSDSFESGTRSAGARLGGVRHKRAAQPETEKDWLL